MTNPEEMSVDELEALLAKKKEEQSQVWETQRQEWKKKILPEAEKFGFQIVEKKGAIKRTRKRLSDKDKDAIRAARASGETAKAIAERFGCSLPTVYKLEKSS